MLAYAGREGPYVELAPVLTGDTLKPVFVEASAAHSYLLA
jgi:hypothetical protein